jgi:acyl-CoA synthetase (AMP-forming)/AMP-acid ligase II
VGQTYLSPAPLYHSAPQASISGTMRLGGTSVIMEKFDPAQFLDLVGKYRITHSQMVPTMFSRLLKLPHDVRAAADLSSLECIIHAAAPCPVPVKQQMIEWFGPLIIEYYGATEANGFTFCDSHEWLAHPGTVGKCILGELLILTRTAILSRRHTRHCVVQGRRNFEYSTLPTRRRVTQRDGRGEHGRRRGVRRRRRVPYLTDRKTYMIISGRREHLPAGRPRTSSSRIRR